MHVQVSAGNAENPDGSLMIVPSSDMVVDLELSRLTALTDLHLDFVPIIWGTLCCMPQLRKLRLGWMEDKCTLPDQLTALSCLKHLHFKELELRGPIRVLSQLASLQSLICVRVALGSSPAANDAANDAVGRLTSLTALRMEGRAESRPWVVAPSPWSRLRHLQALVLEGMGIESFRSAAAL